MNQFITWLTMGGYSFYVWSAYGLVLAVLLINFIGVKWQRVQTRKKLQLWIKRQKV